MRFKVNEAALGKLRAAADAGVEDAARLVFEASQRQVPTETGRLRQSGRVEPDGLSARIEYGEGIPDERAIEVHERFDLFHDDGQAKFLEGPLNALRQQALQAMADRIRQGIG